MRVSPGTAGLPRRTAGAGPRPGGGQSSLAVSVTSLRPQHSHSPGTQSPGRSREAHLDLVSCRTLGPLGEMPRQHHRATPLLRAFLNFEEHRRAETAWAGHHQRQKTATAGPFKSTRRPSQMISAFVSNNGNNSISPNGDKSRLLVPLEYAVLIGERVRRISVS